MMSRLALTFSLAACTPAARISKRQGRRAPATVAGVPILSFSEEASADDFNVFFEEGTTEDGIADFCDGKCSLSGHPGHGGAAFASVKGQAALEVMLNRRTQAGVKIDFVETDGMVYPIPFVEGDEPGIESSASWGLDAVGVPDSAVTGRGVHIYVQDTGIRTTHIDFGGRASSVLDITSGELVLCRGDPQCALDDVGHGTHCAGTAASTTYGVAKDARVYASRTLTFRGGPNSWQYQAVDWVGANAERPAVLSMSLGGRGADQGWTPVLKMATDAGVVIVVAAGNSVENACGFSPAFAEAAITVGATSRDNQRGWYSNFGSCVNIMAPGSNIISTWGTSDNAQQDNTGTSMACPHVSGAAALVLETDNRMTVAQVRARIMDNASPRLIGDIRGSADKFLWVGASPAPTGAPAPPPNGCGETTTGIVDSDGDCRCARNLNCFQGDRAGCPFSRPGRSAIFHAATCDDCSCRSRPR